MLTNAYETQVVQSLGVRIGPEGVGASTTPGARAVDPSGSGGSCPFAAMIPATGDVFETPPREAAAPAPIRWTAAAEARLANIPAFVRPMARAGIEKFARESGAVEVNDMDRLVERHALADPQGDATRHQRRVERDQTVVRAGIDRAERLLEPCCRLLKRHGK